MLSGFIYQILPITIFLGTRRNPMSGLNGKTRSFLVLGPDYHIQAEYCQFMQIESNVLVMGTARSNLEIVSQLHNPHFIITN